MLDLASCGRHPASLFGPVRSLPLAVRASSSLARAHSLQVQQPPTKKASYAGFIWWASRELSELFALDLYSTDIIKFNWKPLYKDKDFLREHLVEKGQSVRYLAKRISCSMDSIYKAIYRFGLSKDVYGEQEGLERVSYLLGLKGKNFKGPQRGKDHWCHRLLDDEGRRLKGMRANPPYGKRKVNGVLVDHLGELKLIKRILELREDGLSYEKIADYLNKANIPTKKEGSRWFASTIHKIVKDNKK